MPTWLYQAVHLTGTVRKLSDDELAAHLDALSAKFENWLAPKPPWTSSKMTAGRLEAMKKAIVGLVMTVEEVEGSFKLNQHKSDADLCRDRRCAGAAARRSRADDRDNRWSRCGRQLDYKSPRAASEPADRRNAP